MITQESGLDGAVRASGAVRIVFLASARRKGHESLKRRRYGQPEPHDEERAVVENESIFQYALENLSSGHDFEASVM